MRRLVELLLLTTLVLGALSTAGCSGGCPGICQPSGTHEYVVSRECYPVDRNGNRLYRNP